MAELYMGQIIQGAWNFAPNGTHICDGSLLPVTQYSALFTLLGIAFGGDGSSTFGLPDLRGRTMLGSGQGPNRSAYSVGQAGGAESVGLSVANLPPHNHGATFSGSGASLNASTTKATLQVPDEGSVLGRAIDGATNPAALPQIYCPAGTGTTVALAGVNVAGTVTVGMTGSGQPVSVLPPFQVLTTAICVAGIYPARP